MPDSNAAFREGFVDADGFRIRYWEAGEGPPLVHLHGAGGQGIAVVEVGGEFQPPLHFVDDADHVPGHAGRVRHLVVARLALGDGSHNRICRRHHGCWNFHVLPELRVGLAQHAVGESRHLFHPSMQ